MNLSSPNLNALWGNLIVEELWRNGVDYFCISPGSRSAPLTVAAARHPRAKTMVCIDERGAAFHALGYARAVGKPAVLICTSGTAAANYYPAIIEAATDRIPMIILSADRPPELRQTGANQAILQPNLYGEYVKWRFDLPCPAEQISPQMLLTTVDQLVHQSRRSPAGPVHLNCMFREPLAPIEAPFQADYLKSLNTWQRRNIPYTAYPLPKSEPLEDTIEAVVETLNTTARGLLVIGRLNSPEESRAVHSLAEKLAWPVFADVASGLRIGAPGENIIHFFDQLLLSEGFAERHRPATVLHLGGQMVSKRWREFLEKKRPAHYILVQDHPGRSDPTHSLTRLIESDITRFCQRISGKIRPAGNPRWRAGLIRRSRKVQETLTTFLASRSTVSEISVAYHLSRLVPRPGGLFLASSMPVRDMDMYACPSGSCSCEAHSPPASPAHDLSTSPRPQEPLLRVACNRGASGIDGTVACACGFAAGLEGPVTLLIGDLALLHDLNSLAQVQSLSQPLVIVAINNGGGGIFSFLPISEYEDVFEPYFATPQHFDFRHAAAMFGLAYCRPQSDSQLISAYLDALKNNHSTLIEIRTDRAENRELHRRLQQEILSCLDD